jgi:outer membrane protein, heavy metal efflux system
MADRAAHVPPENADAMRSSAPSSRIDRPADPGDELASRQAPDAPAAALRRRRLGACAWLCAAGIGLLAPVPAHAQEPALGESLQGLLAHARAHSPELDAMRREADAAEQRVQPAGALPDPVLRVELMNFNNYGNEASFNLLPSKVGETRYTVMQSLPLWGKRDLRRDVASADARQASARADATWTELAARIKMAYAEFYRTVGNERLVKEILGLMARLEQVAQARYAGGLAGQSDAIRAQLEQTAMRAELLALAGEKQQWQARLNGLLARDGTAALAEPAFIKPLPPLSTADASALAERARARNPQILAERERLAMAQKSRELVQANRYPDLVLGLTPTQVGSRLTSWSLMVEMNLPLQRETRRSQEREAEAMAQGAQARTEALARQLLGELAAQLSALDVARRTETLTRTQLLPQSELSLQSALAAYENGKAEFAMLLDAQRQIRKARQELLKAQVEAQLRVAEIERIVGEDL